MDPAAVDHEEEEGDASQLLRALDYENQHHVLATAAFAELRIRIDPAAPRGCKGFLGQFPAAVCLPAKGSPLLIQRLGRHELGHIAKIVGGHPFPHDDESADRVGLRVEIPRWSIVRAWSQCAGDLARLATMYPLVAPTDVYRRLGWAKQWDVIFWFGRRREPSAVGAEDLRDVFRECSLRDEVLRTQAAANDRDGAYAAPLSERGHRPGVVILMPPRVA